MPFFEHVVGAKSMDAYKKAVHLGWFFNNFVATILFDDLQPVKFFKSLIESCQFSDPQ